MFYLGCTGVAASIVTYVDLWNYSTPITFIFLIGYFAGRISKGIER